MLNLLYTSSKTLTITGSSPQLIYVPNADTMYLSDSISGSSRYQRLFRDGTLLNLGNNDSSSVSYDNIDTKDGVVVTLNGFSAGHVIDRITWVSDFLRPIGAAMPKSILDRGAYINDRSGVRKYYRPYFGGYRRYDEATGVLEETVVVTASFTIDSVHFMKEQQICLFDYSAGRVFFYDVDLKVLLLETSIEVAKTACFDTTYQNVVSIRASDFAVQVYDSKARAAKLSPLSAVPGLYDRYTTENLSVQVLGSDDEPIVGIDVKWEVKRLSDGSRQINSEDINTSVLLRGGEFLVGKGIISPGFTVTNENGIATAIYCPPGLNWESGDEEVIIPTVRQ